MDNSQRVSEEMNRKHIEALQSVTDNFLSHLRGVTLAPVTPSKRPLKPPADILDTQKLMVAKETEKLTESGAQEYSEDFESLEESRLPKRGASPIKEEQKSGDGSSIYEEIERQDSLSYKSPSEPKRSLSTKEKRRGSGSPFTSPGAMVEEEEVS